VRRGRRGGRGEARTRKRNSFEVLEGVRQV
jgi:hypothetical protein